MRLAYYLKLVGSCCVHAVSWSWWLLPFLAFWVGYALVYKQTGQKGIRVPALLGMRAADAVCTAGAYGLATHVIVKHLVEADNELVLEQQPSPGMLVRPGGTITLMVNRAPMIVMPDLVRKSYDEIKTWADDVHVQIRQVAIPHSSPTGTCIAQWPCATQACSRQEGIVVLVSASTSPYRLMPDLMGFFFQDAVHVCQQAEVAVERLGEEEGQTIVVHQQPQAGTIIDRRKQIIVLSTAQHAPIFY